MYIDDCSANLWAPQQIYKKDTQKKKKLILTFQLHWLLFVPSTPALTNSTFCPCSVFLSMDLRTNSNYFPSQH